MINPDNISFPITLEAFTALQRAEIDRDFNAAELEIFGYIVELANGAYTAAAKGDVETVRVILDAVKEAPINRDYTRRVAALFRGWVRLGCQKGAEKLKTVIDNGAIS